MADRLCAIGVSKDMLDDIRKDYFGAVIHHDVVPKIFVSGGQLYVERHNGPGMLPVDKVIFYGIFEDDFDLLTGLSIWGGPCFPNPYAMMNCRLKLPCLATALRVSRFNSPRGFVTANTSVNTANEMVAKWGNWHCGENKEKFTGEWTSGEAAIIEPFFDGEAVRVAVIGDHYWQIKLEGADWLKSIHDDRAGFMPIDQELLEDVLHIKQALGLDIIANDYIVGKNGEKHLLEVNHIPNVDRFAPMQDAFVAVARQWLQQ